MATFTLDSAFPNVVTVVGSDVVNDASAADPGGLNRTGLKAALFSTGNPLGNLSGRVDFIVCYVASALPHDSNFSGIDESLTPRPLRGIIQLRQDLSNLNATTVGGGLGGGVAHEVGHYWLVPGEALIADGGAEHQTPTSAQIFAAINSGQSMPPFPIMARQDRHWSPYIDAQDSPMDGVNHTPAVMTPGVGLFNLFGKHSQESCYMTGGPSFNLAGLGHVQTKHRFSALERWIMGDYVPPMFTSIGVLWPKFAVIEPRWSFPVAFQAGLYAEIDSGMTVYFGFDRGPDRIAARSTDGTIAASAALPSSPIDPHVQVGLRIVQRGGQVYFQVRFWRPVQIWFLLNSRFKPSLGSSDVLGDLSGALPSTVGDAFAGWHTMSVVPGSAVRVGVSSRTLGSPCYSLLRARLWESAGGTTQQLSLTSLSPVVPTAGPALLGGERLMMPYAFDATGAKTYDETTSVHNAPKLLKNAPGGDFAIGGILSLDSCLMANWAGGDAVGKTLVGFRRVLKLNQFKLTWPGNTTSIRKGAPLGGAYKTLFVLAANANGDIQPNMVAGLDTMRRGWEQYFRLITNRRVDTSVPF